MSNPTQIQERVLKILESYTRKDDVLAKAMPETSILIDLKVNSARFVDLVLDVEDEFEIEIKDSETNLINTIGELIELIEKKLG